MKDEIKEILDYFIKYKDNWYSCEYILKPKQCVLLLDYITNLHEENERLNNIITELEKDMREKYHKEIDYQSKIMQSDLMQGDYPVSYYYAEQNEKLLNHYLNKLKELKEGK